MIGKALAFFLLSTTAGACDAMECLEVTKNHTEEELKPLLEEHVIGQKVTQLNQVFCNETDFVYLADSTFAVHITIESKGIFPSKVYRFVFHFKSVENEVTEILNITTGILTL